MFNFAQNDYYVTYVKSIWYLFKLRPKIEKQKIKKKTTNGRQNPRCYIKKSVQHNSTFVWPARRQQQQQPKHISRLLIHHAYSEATNGSYTFQWRMCLYQMQNASPKTHGCPVYPYCCGPGPCETIIILMLLLREYDIRPHNHGNRNSKPLHFRSSVKRISY